MAAQVALLLHLRFLAAVGADNIRVLVVIVLLVAVTLPGASMVLLMWKTIVF
jgi:hypothetical protein